MTLTLNELPIFSVWKLDCSKKIKLRQEMESNFNKSKIRLQARINQQLRYDKEGMDCFIYRLTVWRYGLNKAIKDKLPVIFT